MGKAVWAAEASAHAAVLRHNAWGQSLRITADGSRLIGSGGMVRDTFLW